MTTSTGDIVSYALDGFRISSAELLSFKISPPEVRSNTVVIPGMDGVLDLSESMTGRPVYGMRKITMEFSTKANFDYYGDVVSKYHGRVVKVQINSGKDRYPGWYTGRCTVSPMDVSRDLHVFYLDILADPFLRSNSSMQKLSAFASLADEYMARFVAMDPPYGLETPDGDKIYMSNSLGVTLAGDFGCIGTVEYSCDPGSAYVFAAACDNCSYKLKASDGTELGSSFFGPQDGKFYIEITNQNDGVGRTCYIDDIIIAKGSPITVDTGLLGSYAQMILPDGVNRIKMAVALDGTTIRVDSDDGESFYVPPGVHEIAAVDMLRPAENMCAAGDYMYIRAAKAVL